MSILYIVSLLLKGSRINLSSALFVLLFSHHKCPQKILDSPLKQSLLPSIQAPFLLLSFLIPLAPCQNLRLFFLGVFRIKLKLETGFQSTKRRSRARRGRCIKSSRNKNLFRFCTRFHFLIRGNDSFFVEDINLLDYGGGLEYPDLESILERGELGDGAFEGDA